MSRHVETDSLAECVEAIGPSPFITRRIHTKADGTLAEWSSRHHRKSLVLPESAKVEANSAVLLRCLWMPRKLNWWIGVIFATGATLFALASVLGLATSLAARWSIDLLEVNGIYFAGSIPFTIAAYLQLFQAANAGQFSASKTPRSCFFGWRPHDIGWLSCALQLVGTILFNINTFDALIPSLTWVERSTLVWVPNFFGSIFFLLSGYLAFIETCHAHWAWKPKSISWWVVVVNLFGCVGFMVSAAFSVVLLGPPNEGAVTLATVFTLQGAIGFLVGSLLMLPETAVEAKH